MDYLVNNFVKVGYTAGKLSFCVFRAENGRLYASVSYFGHTFVRPFSSEETARGWVRDMMLPIIMGESDTLRDVQPV